MSHLPTPSDEALEHSQKLIAHISEKLQTYGSITFAEFMNECLYAPGLGYYSAGSQKFGQYGDFITSPEISPLFGTTLAQFLLPYFIKNPSDSILELGPGSGKLASHIMLHLATHGILPEKYYLLEVSADLKQRQQSYLAETLPSELYQKFAWYDRLPEAFSGTIIANEVLDALPVHRFYISDHGPQEFYVSEQDEKFIWQLKTPSSKALIEALQSVQNQYHLAPGYISEINLHQNALISSLANCLQQGLIIFIDYGFPGREYYHPDRSQGTLVCHYRHHVHDDVFFVPGLQDITAHVDFTAAALSLLNNQCELACFTNQASFLIACGITELAQQKSNYVDHIQQSQQIQKLTSPAEMGELFKVLVSTKNLDSITWRNSLHAVDQRHRL